MKKFIGIFFFVLSASVIQMQAHGLLFNGFRESNHASIYLDHPERDALNENLELSACNDGIVHLGYPILLYITIWVKKSAIIRKLPASIPKFDQRTLLYSYC